MTNFIFFLKKGAAVNSTEADVRLAGDVRSVTLKKAHGKPENISPLLSFSFFFLLLFFFFFFFFLLLLFFSIFF